MPYRIRRSDRARRIRVSVDGNGEVEVVLPRRSPERHAEEAVRELRAVDRAPPARGRRARRSEVGRAPGHRALPGRDADARARARAHARAPARRRCCSSPPATRGAALERWYRRQARAEVAPRLDAATARAGTRVHGPDDPRPAHALGVVLVHGRDVVQLAAAARAAGDPRLRRRARGLPPRGDGPLAALLARCSPSRSPRWRAHSAWLKPLRLDARRSEARAAARAYGVSPPRSSGCAARSRRSTRRPSRRRARRRRALGARAGP